MMSIAGVIAGLGAVVPPRVVTNRDLSETMNTSDEWISGRTGIRARRWVWPGTATSDLAVEAGALALKSAGESPVDAVIVATTTPDRLCPATAPEVASRLGLSGVAAYDVAAVCSGFVYGLANAIGLLCAGIGERVLLIGAETYSTIIDRTDRTTAPIFGDGAGAVVVRSGETAEPGCIGPFVLGSDGDFRDLAAIAAGGSRQRSGTADPAPGDHYLQLRGREVYRHAVDRMSTAGAAALDRAGWSVADVDRLAAHQANAKIVNAVADRLEIPESKRLSNIERVGNTAAASIPLLLAHAAAAGSLSGGDRVLMVAFGGGLTWGATTVTWPSITPCTNL